MHALGLRPREVVVHLALTMHGVLPSACPYGVGTSKVETVFSRLNVLPACSLVNASATPSRERPHDSGPLQMANPFNVGDFHSLLSRRF